MLYRKKPILIVGAALASLIVLSGCSGTSTPSPSSTNTAKVLNLGAREDLLTWDPTASTEGHQYQYTMAVYDTLLKWSPKGEPLPNVATHWSYNPTRTVLTMTIKEGIRFSDGEKLDANAVAANLEAEKKGTGNGAGYLTSLKSVAATDPTTVVLTLTQPDPSLLYNLGGGTGEIAAPNYLGKASLKTHPVGSGPYRLDASTAPGSKYVLDRTKDYWGGTSDYPFQTVNIIPLVDDTARFSALQSGQVEAISGTGSMVQEAKSRGLEVSLNPGDRVGLILADRTGKILKPMGDVRVRQAINYAMDSKGILDKLGFGFGYTTDQLFAKTSDGWNPAVANAYPYDVAKAKKLLAEAGYPNGFTLPFVTSDYFSTYQATFKQLMSAIGITVEYTKVPAANLLTELLSGKYPAFFYPLATSPNSWKDAVFNASPSGAVNFFHSQTPELDALLTTARDSSGDTQSNALKQVSKYLVDNAWFDPWYVQDDVYIYSSSLKVTAQDGNIVPLLDEIKPAK